MSAGKEVLRSMKQRLCSHKIDVGRLLRVCSIFMSSMQQAFEGGTEEKERKKEEEDGSVPSPHVGTRRGGLVFGSWSKVSLG